MNKPIMPLPQEREAALFALALEKPIVERAAFLQAVCREDDLLRQRLEALLAAHEEPGTLLAGQVKAATNKLDNRTAPDEAVGQTLGRSILLERLGEGGCGVVYVAEQTEPVRRRVALKVIKLGMDTRQVVARFEAERQALAMMDHPNIAKVLDAGTTETGRPYFVMELVRGIRITDYCDQANLSTRERLDLFIKVCQAIQHAHQKGIIHRDIKPSNILVTLHDGVPIPKVIDFGIAKATEGRLTDATVYTQLHQFIGTPAYMSPEQAEMSGLDIDTRSDIYSLGVLLYELLAGRTPFDAKELMASSIDAMRKIIREKEPVRPSTRLVTMAANELTTTAKRRSVDTSKLFHQLQGDLDWIVMKCLEKDRTRRYETANGVAADLKRHLDNEPVIARPPSAGYRFQKAIRRNKLAFTAGAVVFAVLALGIVLSSWQAVRANREARRAVQAEGLAKQRLTESEAISKFLTEVFQSPDPALDGRAITVAETLGAAAIKLESDLASQPARRAALQATLGKTYNALGLYREAIPLWEKVRDYRVANSGPEHPGTIDAMAGLANSYSDAGREDEALKLREEVLALSRKVLGPAHPDTLKAMNNLAISYGDASRREQALKLREEVLAIRRKVSGPEHPDTLKAMGNLATSYSEDGRLDEALSLREEVLALRRKVLGAEHPDTLMEMGNLAFSYDEAGRRDEALKLGEKVLALHRKVLGAEHPDTLREMVHLANYYRGADRLDEALKLAMEALELDRKVLGPEHPGTLAAMANLGVIYGGLGRQDEALKLDAEVLALRRKVSGPEHPNTLRAMRELGNSYRAAGRWDEALKLREEVLALSRKVLGLEHLDTLREMNNLAFSYSDAGRRDEALKLREKVLALHRKLLGAEHPDTLMTMGNLANSYSDAGRPAEAVKLREQVLALSRKVLGPEHRSTLVAMDNLASSYSDASRTDEALKLREETLTLCRKVFGEEHRTTLVVMDNLAESYCGAGRRTEAIALLEKACKTDPKGSDASLNLAVFQAWFGLDAGYEITRQRALQQAEGTGDGGTADRAAKAYSMRPSTDDANLEKALQLGRRAVELLKGTPSEPWPQMAFGIAQYRNGRYANAIDTLSLADKKAGELMTQVDRDEVQGISRMFRVMSLFRLNRQEEAHRLFSQAEAQMPPLPSDENKPLAKGMPFSHDLLIWWLAYNEAKMLLNEPIVAKPFYGKPG